MRKMKHLRTFCAVLLFTGFTSSAWADVITINASDYPLGTDLSHMLEGVSMAKLSSFGGLAETVSPVYAVSTYHAPGVLSFGGLASTIDEYQTCHNNPGSLSCYGYDVLELRFDAPTDFVQINGFMFSDGPDMMAYDTAGAVIAGFRSRAQPSVITYAAVGSGYSTSVTITRDARDIARVVYGGLLGNASPTQVTYNVPEPTTLGFMSLGLLSAGLFRTRSSSTRR